MRFITPIMPTASSQLHRALLQMMKRQSVAGMVGMTKRNNDQSSLSEDVGRNDNPKAEDHSVVGYKRPPVQGRFQKGRSGNPHGRPKGYWSGKDLLQKALAVPLTVTENGVVRKLPQREILFRSLLAKAIKGDNKSITMVFNLVDKWKIDQSHPTVTRIERVIIDPDGSYYDLDLGKKMSIHDRKRGPQTTMQQRAGDDVIG